MKKGTAKKKAPNPASEPVHGERVFTTGIVSAISGVGLPTLANWAMNDFLTPSVRPAGGRGRSGWRGYTFEDIVAARVTELLRRSGITMRESLKPIVGMLQHYPNLEGLKKGDTLMLPLGSKEPRIVRGKTSGSIHSVIDPGRDDQPEALIMLSMDLFDVVFEVRRALAELLETEMGQEALKAAREAGDPLPESVMAGLEE